jgi:hypothetical protein
VTRRKLKLTAADKDADEIQDLIPTGCERLRAAERLEIAGGLLARDVHRLVGCPGEALLRAKVFVGCPSASDISRET